MEFAELPTLIFFLSSSGKELPLKSVFLEFLSKYFVILTITFNIKTLIPKCQNEFVSIATNRLKETNIMDSLEKLHVTQKRVCSLRLHYGKQRFICYYFLNALHALHHYHL